jgi:hypothetical protein
LTLSFLVALQTSSGRASEKCRESMARSQGPIKSDRQLSTCRWKWDHVDRRAVVTDTGSLGVSVYYPAQFAFNQEVLAREQYSALSGAIEVQWQAGAMIAGGLASFLINRVPLTMILLIDTCTFAAGLLVLRMVPYRRNPNLDANVRSAWKMMFEGFTYLRIRPRLSLVIFGSFLPFLGIFFW